MDMKDRSTLINRIEKFSEARVSTLGDVLLERFVYGQVSRISPEAPVPVFRSERIELGLGGAGNVVCNLCAMGARVSFVSVIGADSCGRLIRIEEVVGRGFVRHYGGEVVLADVADIYTTNSTSAHMTKGIF
jgi:bifunctional ADP-heptose synthase (sugar kinase/adenylyltransferase)